MCFCLAWHIPSKPSVFHVLVKGSLLRRRRKKKGKASPSAPISPGWPQERPVSHTPGVPGRPQGSLGRCFQGQMLDYASRCPLHFIGTPHFGHEGRCEGWKVPSGLSGPQTRQAPPLLWTQFSLPDTPSSHRWPLNSLRTWPRRHRAAFPRRLLCPKGVPITSIRALFLLGQWPSMGIITFSSYLFSHLSFIWPAIGKLLHPIHCPFL